jgi:N-methylhydantoinase B/oxoprolinase/acetone carboxylase alpha subunit
MAARTANGSNRIERADGRVEHLPATASAAMEPGDVFVIETPGGGWRSDPDGRCRGLGKVFYRCD